MAYFVITANRLTDGVAVWRDADGGWATLIGQSAVFAADAIEPALELARLDVARQRVVGVYRAEVTQDGAAPVPLSVRETIRARGPSVRLDLGVQASA